MSDSSWWPVDYFASRKRFRELAQRCGARMESLVVEAAGPDDETLSVDVAALTSGHDEHLIVITSGVHGVEGFIGGNIQIRALQMLANRVLPAQTGIVMIHAVNPWGFAHLRRVDENNTDVNRNFINTAPVEPVSHPQYAELDPVINPRRAPGRSGEIRYWMSALKLIVRSRGIGQLFKPIAEGQYDFPRGVFFGGFEVGESCRILQDSVLRHCAEADRVTILDVHSGLGPSATATLIGSTNLIAPDQQKSWLQAHYQQAVLIDNASSNTYNAQGTFSQWCQHSLADKRFLYLCVEIGTVNPIKLFSALRRENQAHHWASSESTSYEQTKRALLEVFAPPSTGWREKATAQGLRILEQTLDLSTKFARCG